MIDANGNPLAGQIPSGWEAYLPIALSMTRVVLNVLGGVGFTWALAVNASQIQMAASAALILVSAIWSGWQKIRAVHALRVASQQPAGMTPPALPS